MDRSKPFTYDGTQGLPYEIFEEGDFVRVTGEIQTTGLEGTVVRDLKVEVTTLNMPNHEEFPNSGYFFKVSPRDDSDPQLPPEHDRRLWFDASAEGTTVRWDPGEQVEWCFEE